ncbi:MAG: NAD(+) synthase, partial [candidate division NC10 bacterium]|nr:NAD(+) synthase [candidate division NC10 bacterium]
MNTGALPLTLDYAVTAQVLTAFIEDEVRKSSFGRVVVGLSGGVDSSTSAALAAKALGPGNVWGLLLPYRESSQESREHAALAVRWLGINSEMIDITPMIDAYFAREPEADRVRRGNKMARERMTILYDYSAKLRALVLGTSNKTELLLGYGTLYGDMASALNPLGDLYKTHVRGLARHLGVPA